MKQWKISKAEEKRQAAFDEKVANFLRMLCAEKVERDPFQSSVIRNTVAGPLLVTPMGDWIACRFEDIELAKSALGHEFGKDHRLNPYSGKWNFCAGSGGKFHAETSFLHFKFEMRKLLTTEMPRAMFHYQSTEQTPMQAGPYKASVKLAEENKAWALANKDSKEWINSACDMSKSMMAEQIEKSVFEMALYHYRYWHHRAHLIDERSRHQIDPQARRSWQESGGMLEGELLAKNL